MADVFNIAPPTQEEIKAKPVVPGNVSTFDPRDPDLPEGTTPQQATIELRQDVLPSRVTGKGDAGGLDFGFLGDINRGFNDMVLALPDAAINAVVKGLESAGLVEPNTVDRNVLSRVFNSSDYESQKTVIPYLLTYGTGRYGGQAEEEGTLSSIMRSGGQAGALALPFYGAASRTAQATATLPSALAAKTAPSSLSTAQLVRESFLSPYRTAPLGTAIAEGTLGTLSGMGAQAEQEFTGGQTGLGAMAPLGVAGLFYGAKTAATKGPVGRVFNWLGKITGNAVDEFAVNKGIRDPGEGPRGQQAKGQLQEEVAAAASSREGYANVQRAAEIEQTLSPYVDEPIRLSPAEQTMDKPLLTTQARLEGSGSPEFTRANMDRKSNVLEAAQRFKDAELVGSPVDEAPLWVFDAATGKYNATVGRLNRADQTLADNWAMVTNSDTGIYPSLAAEPSKAGGRSLRSSIIEGRNRAKEAANKLAKKLKINDADQFSSRDAVAAAKQAVRDSVMTRQGEEAFSYDQIHPLVRKFIESNIDRMSFQDFKQTRDNVGDAIGAALAQNRSSDIRALGALRDSLDDMAKAFGRTNEKFEDYRSWYEANVIEPYERSGVIKVTTRGSGATKEDPVYLIPEENVANAFLENSNTARQFVRLFGDDETQKNHIRSVLLDKLRNQAYNDKQGSFDPSKVGKFLDNNKEVLSELGLLDEFTNTRQVLDNMVSRQADLTARRRVISGNLMMKTIARLENTESPEKLLDSALNNPGLMRQLRTKISRGGEGLEPEQAKEAFRAAVMERLFAKAPEAMDNPANFKKWLAKPENERVLNAAFDKSHVDNLYLVADAVERILATGLPEGGGVVNNDIITRFTNMFGITPPMASNRWLAVQEGRIGAKAAVGYVAGRMIRARSTARADALFREMMFNPEIAKLLATEGGENVPAFGISEPLKRRLNTYLFNLGISYGDEVRPDVDESIFQIQPNLPEKPITVSPPREEKKEKRIFDVLEPPPIVPYVPLNQTQGSGTPPTPVNTTVTPSNTQTSVDPALLFPNDPTSIAIARRRAPQSGIATV